MLHGGRREAHLPVQYTSRQGKVFDRSYVLNTEAFPGASSTSATSSTSSTDEVGAVVSTELAIGEVHVRELLFSMLFRAHRGAPCGMRRAPYAQLGHTLA